MTASSSRVPRIVDAPGGPLTLFESGDVNGDLDAAIERNAPAPYGRVMWSSAPAVAQRLASLDLRGKRVLEIGAGTGLVSLVAARLGARVLATDVDDGALALLAHAAANAGLHVDTAPFDITGADPLPHADVVAVADLIYEEALAAAAARRVAEAKGRGSLVVAGDPGRVFRAQFVKLLDACGVAVAFDHDGVAVI